MKIAILSDVHSNLQALTAVLEDLNRQKAEKIFCLGDSIGYGANPSECLSLLETNRIELMVRGNHDDLIRYFKSSSGIVKEMVVEEAYQALEYSFRVLDKKAVKKLSSLPEFKVVPEFDMKLAHGACEANHVFRYIHDAPSAESDLSESGARIAVVGHTHWPMIVKQGSDLFFSRPFVPLGFGLGERFFVNVGSVGQPRDRDPRACYALFEFDGLCTSVQFRRVEYDIQAAAAAIRKAGLPDSLADRLFGGR